MGDTPAHRLAATRMFLTQGDVDDLIELANSIADPEAVATVIDLGAGSGTTAIAMLDTLRRTNVITYDISEENLNWAEKNIIASLGEQELDRWAGIHDSVLDGAAKWGASKVDLILHDASHEEDDVYADLKAWWPHLVKGGYIWVHDVDPMAGAQETYPGVKRGILRFTDEHRRELVPVPDMRGIGWAARRTK